MFALVVFVVAIFGSVAADSRNFGQCPHIDPLPHFEMHKFLGEWYAIQRTATDVPCLTYNITEKPGHPGYYHFIESHPNSKLAQLVGLGPENKKVGDLCAKNEKEPAVMDLELPYEIGSSKFTVFMTDYDNYAAIFVCKTYPLTFNRFRKWSAQILSRTPTLAIEYIEKIRTRLAAYNVDPFTLSKINQHHCEYHDHHESTAQTDATLVQTSDGKVEENMVLNSKTEDDSKIDEKPEVFELYDSQATSDKPVVPVGSYGGHTNPNPTEIPV
ncbi:hypothetical protein PPYR_02874 [Photinus pyralis]|uniref:Lipocalin/cytosolic fatty-acid binding domain-containing protein n=1 Tax=Photinus pyralis TaxID=7054 RepID=A0A1Y1LQA2_PHOPY|nr:apolipoprotein D-like [Photinus pyralis]KAB0791074.1 hypothetical protein PPYR_02874 [Photinus pyralis]